MKKEKKRRERRKDKRKEEKGENKKYTKGEQRERRETNKDERTVTKFGLFSQHILDTSDNFYLIISIKNRNAGEKGYAPTTQQARQAVGPVGKATTRAEVRRGNY